MRRQYSLWLSLIQILLLRAHAQDDVRLPPTIVAETSGEILYRPDAAIELQCIATGTGNIEYSWYKNGEVMELNNNIYRVKGRGEHVTIISASGINEGYYRCQAASQFGTAMSNTVRLQQALSGYIPNEEIYEERVEEGKPFRIRIQQPKSVPPATYFWETAVDKYDTKPNKVLPSQRIQIDSEGNLHFAYALKEDAADGRIYKLVTLNRILDNSFGGSYRRIIVDSSKDGNANFAPALNSSFPSGDPTYVAVVGRNFTLRCFVPARPVAEYNWKVPDSSKKTPSPTNSRTELFVSDVRPEDEGTYRCTASNTLGTAVKQYKVLVEAAPYFKSDGDKLHNTNITEGMTATFRCKAEGKPEPTTVWYMNGQVIDNYTPPPRITFGSNYETLIVRDVCRDCSGQDRSTDLMVIQCNSSNVHGYNLSSAYLNVLKRTVVTSLSKENHVKIKHGEARTVVFRCEASSDPSTPVSIEWRRVDTKNQNNDQPIHPDNKVVFVTDGELKFVIEDTNNTNWEEYLGQYLCKANNSYSADSKHMSISMEATEEVGTAGMWWIFLLIVLILFLIILVLCCCIYLQRNRGDTYPVDEKERLNGNDPEQEIMDCGFQDYRRPEGLRKGSGASLGSSAKLNSEGGESLNDYGSVDPGKFTEDGSFMGAYTGTVDRNKARFEP